MSSIHDFFRGGSVNAKELSTYLDALPSSERIAQTTALSAKEQAALWDAAKDFREVRVEDIVPRNQPPLVEVIHYGRNSLPAFTSFQKRFCRPDAESSELWGYNHQTLSPFTGPGYFVTSDAEDGEVLIDYCRIPPGKPASWPKILPNSARLSRFVYFNMKDYLRGVSRHVTIGRATKQGKTLDNWFILCREEI